MNKRIAKKIDKRGGRSYKVYLTLYMTDRAYGGAEEGGWWYDCGYPEIFFGRLRFGSMRFFAIENKALKMQDDLNEGRMPVSSVISDGEYRLIIEHDKPAHYPTRRPHYE